MIILRFMRKKFKDFILQHKETNKGLSVIVFFIRDYLLTFAYQGLSLKICFSGPIS